MLPQDTRNVDQLEQFILLISVFSPTIANIENITYQLYIVDIYMFKHRHKVPGF